MPLPEGFNALALASVGIISLGVLLHIIGLATPEWSVEVLHVNGLGNSESRGLWKRCLENNFVVTCDDYIFTSTSDSFSSILMACEAFAILGMLASFLGLAKAAISVLFPMMGKPKNPKFAAISFAACVASTVCILITVSVWGALVNVPVINRIGYSCILSIIGGVLISVGGGLIHVSNKRAS